MLREAYAKYNVYPVGVSWWGVESIVAKKPIKKMEDFKGVKFRSPQGMTAEILTKLGASIVVLPGGEVFSALDKGVVDAADWATISMNQRMGFHERRQVPDQGRSTRCRCRNSPSISRRGRRCRTTSRASCIRRTREWTWDQVQRVAVDDVRVLKELSAKGVKHEIWDDAQMVKMRELAHEDLGRLVEEDAARQAGLRLAAGLAQGPGRGCMTDAGGRQRERCRDARPVCTGAILRLSRPAQHWVGPLLGCDDRVRHARHPLRGGGAAAVFGNATIWANETTVYLSAVAYLLGGGYALLQRAPRAHRPHLRGAVAARQARASTSSRFVFFSPTSRP